jgi:tRNA(fMet)-specific endonuclease VapC
MKHLLLDTSVIIDFLRRKDKENTLLYKLSEEHLSISIITHTELFAGKSVWEHEKTRAAVSDVLEGVTIIPLSEEISRKAGQIKAKTGASLFDSIIAATSLLHHLEVVTLNNKDFETISELPIFSEK